MRLAGGGVASGTLKSLAEPGDADTERREGGSAYHLGDKKMRSRVRQIRPGPGHVKVETKAQRRRKQAGTDAASGAGNENRGDEEKIGSLIAKRRSELPLHEKNDH